MVSIEYSLSGQLLTPAQIARAAMTAIVPDSYRALFNAAYPRVQIAVGDAARLIAERDGVDVPGEDWSITSDHHQHIKGPQDPPI
jgi:hypothetical protein